MDMVNAVHYYTRLTSIRTVFRGLEKTLDQVIKQGEEAAKEDYPGFDWEDVQLICEEIYGPVFVLAQSFLRGEFIKLSNHSKVILKEDSDKYLRNFGSKIGKSAITRLELYIALANCYKHSDEWGVQIAANQGPKWVVDKKNTRTVLTLRKVKIQEAGLLTCLEGVHILTGTGHKGIFKIIFNDIAKWRNELVKLDGGSVFVRDWDNKSGIL